MEIPEKPRLGIVGGGSWATAIAKILTETNDHINWFMRNIDTIKAFRALSHNPRYLCGVEFDLSKITGAPCSSPQAGGQRGKSSWLRRT